MARNRRSIRKKDADDIADLIISEDWENNKTTMSSTEGQLTVAYDIEFGPVKIEKDLLDDPTYELDSDNSYQRQQPATKLLMQAIKPNDSCNFKDDRKYKKHISGVSRKDKIALIKAVEKRPVIYDLTKKSDHSLRTAWESISAEIGEDVNYCRATWKSLRDSLRYYSKKNAKTNIQADWDLAEHMSFLPQVTSRPTSTQFNDNPEESNKRKRTDSEDPLNQLSNGAKSDEEDCSMMFTDDKETAPYSIPKSETEESDSGAACSYQPKKRYAKPDLEDPESRPSSSYQFGKKRKVPSSSRVQATDNDIMDTISHLMKQSKNLLATPTLKHYDMYLFWDKIMADLPGDALNEVRFRVTALLQDIVKEHTDKLS